MKSYARVQPNSKLFVFISGLGVTKGWLLSRKSRFDPVTFFLDLFEKVEPQKPTPQSQILIRAPRDVFFWFQQDFIGFHS